VGPSTFLLLCWGAMLLSRECHAIVDPTPVKAAEATLEKVRGSAAAKEKEVGAASPDKKEKLRDELQKLLETYDAAAKAIAGLAEIVKQAGITPIKSVGDTLGKSAPGNNAPKEGTGKRERCPSTSVTERSRSHHRHCPAAFLAKFA